MKNLVCPVSQEKIYEHLPRVTAFYVISLFLVYILTGFLPVLIFLLYDFLVRGANQSRYSILFQMARLTSKMLKLKSNSIDKAPKLFAARIGTVLTSVAIIFQILGFIHISVGVALLVMVFSTLECVFNLCVACYIYTFLIFPLYSE